MPTPPYRHGPWQVVKSSEPYRDSWVEVRLDCVIRPDGNPGTYTVVHVKHGVCVMALDNDGLVHLTEEFHYGVGRVTIEGVSGGCEADEPRLTTARRELREELGIEAAQWFDFGLVDPFTANVVSPTQLYLARDLTFGHRSLEGTEVIRHVTLPTDELIQAALTGKISHGPSAVLALKIGYALRRDCADFAAVGKLVS